MTQLTWMTQMTKVAWICNCPNFPVEVLTWSDNLQRSLNDQMTCVLRKVGHLPIWHITQITFGMTSQLLVTSLVIWRSGRHFTKWPKWPKWPNKLYLSLKKLRSGPYRAPTEIYVQTDLQSLSSKESNVTPSASLNLLEIQNEIVLFNDCSPYKEIWAAFALRSALAQSF